MRFFQLQLYSAAVFFDNFLSVVQPNPKPFNIMGIAFSNTIKFLKNLIFIGYF